jgi:dihydroneopterin aldolase
MNAAPSAEAGTPVGQLETLNVFVRGLTVEAQIGINADEFGRRQPLVIDVEIALIPPERCEHIAETINYELVVSNAQAIAAAGHVRLIETFAQRLAEAMLAEPAAMRVRVRVEKPQALAPHALAAGVEITLVR